MVWAKINEDDKELTWIEMPIRNLKREEEHRRFKQAMERLKIPRRYRPRK